MWFYQKLAKKAGKERYLLKLKSFKYGNCKIGNDITNFWLKEDSLNLKITPLEQIAFLKKIYRQQLSLSTKTYNILNDIMLTDLSENYKVYAKTGASTNNWSGHGWYIGYVTSKDKTWFFVTNILIHKKDDLPKRKDIIMAILKKKKII